MFCPFYRFQAAELQAELNNLKMKYANVLNETEETRDGKGTKVAKVTFQLAMNVSSFILAKM